MDVQTSYSELSGQPEEEEEEEEEEEDSDNEDIETVKERNDREESQTEGALLDGGLDDHSPPSPTSNRMAIKFTCFRELVLLLLILFYLADIALDIWVAVRLFKAKHSKRGWFVVFCILVPNLYAGYKSLQWYLRAHDLEPITHPLPWVIRILFFPLSLFLRYLDTWKFGCGSRDARKKHDRKREIHLFSQYLIESAEVSMLRLFIIFLEDAPIAVLNVREFIAPSDYLTYSCSHGTCRQDFEMVLVVMFKLVFTMTLGVVHFITSTKAVYHAAKSEQIRWIGSQWAQQIQLKGDWQKRGFLSVPAQMTIYLWHFCAIGSRLVAYAMFISTLQRYIWLLVGLRWIVNTVWIKMDAEEISLTNCIAFGGVYLFSFVPTSTKHQLNRILVYYCLTFVEDIIIAVLFIIWPSDSPYREGALAVVFGGALVSMFFMCLYYGALHPSKERVKVFQWKNQNWFSDSV